MAMRGSKIYFWGKGVRRIIVYLPGRVGVRSLFSVTLAIYIFFARNLDEVGSFEHNTVPVFNLCG